MSDRLQSRHAARRLRLRGEIDFDEFQAHPPLEQQIMLMLPRNLLGALR
jgi:hypothetical protein